MTDAVVIGAGPNGLVAANLLADAGWDVVVLEAQPEPGGAVRTAELTLPDFRHDVGSAFYPLAARSPVLRGLGLEAHGLTWRHAPVALANPLPDGRCAVLSTDLDETAAAMDGFAPGDGDRWRELYGRWERLGDHLVRAIFTPFPPARAGGRLLGALGPRGLLDFARFALLPVRRLADEHFRGPAGGILLGGNALHADLSPESAAGGAYGWLMSSLAQEVGYPVAEGGAGCLTQSLVDRLVGRGGRVECSTSVSEVVVRSGRAVAVRAGAIEIGARRAVLADVSAPALYRDLVAEHHLPGRLLDNLVRFEWDTSVFKVDWALDGPVPWTAPEARRAGTVHLADDLDHLSEVGFHLATGHLPARPFILFGQQSLADPTRAPAGGHTGWAYCHVPRRVKGDAAGELGTWGPADLEAFADRMEARVERLAPGFRGSIRARSVLAPSDLQARDANLDVGAIAGGTAQIHQQLVFRPTPGLGRPETPIRGLFLASASAHPGGGVHGAPGANAARAALRSAATGRLAGGLAGWASGGPRRT